MLDDQLINQSCPFSSKDFGMSQFFISLHPFFFFSKSLFHLCRSNHLTKWHTGGPASKSHFSHISLEKHLRPRLIMNKNKKAGRHIDFNLFRLHSHFLSLSFSSEKRMNVKQIQWRRGEEDQPHHYLLFL